MLIYPLFPKTLVQKTQTVIMSTVSLVQIPIESDDYDDKDDVSRSISPSETFYDHHINVNNTSSNNPKTKINFEYEPQSININIESPNGEKSITSNNISFIAN